MTQSQMKWWILLQLLLVEQALCGADEVIDVQSRPVVNMKRDISIKPLQIDLEQYNCKGRDGVCVDVEACFTFTAHTSTYSPNITLEVLFEADTERRKLGLPHRVTFLGGSSLEPEYTQTEEVELHGQASPACTTATFQLHENIRDKLRPISLSITHNIKTSPPHRPPGPLRLPDLTPVLNVDTSNTLHSEVNFLKQGCGEDRICQSNLKLSYQFGTRAWTTDLFTPLPRDEEGVAVFNFRSDQRSVVLEIAVSNEPSPPSDSPSGLEENGDDAHAAQLLVSLPPTLSYSGFRGQQEQMVCQANYNGSQVECELGNPLKRDAKLKFYIILSTSDITIETQELAVGLVMTTISEQSDLAPITALAKVVTELPLSVSGLARPHQLFFSGAVRGESAVLSQDDIGSTVDFEFTVTNFGMFRETLGSAFLNIMWPHKLTNGKWLLYPTSLHFDGHAHSHCTPHSALNPLKLSANLSDPSQPPRLFDRRKRSGRSHSDEEGAVTTEGAADRTTPAVSANERQKSLKLDCLLGSARCVLFQCPLHKISGSAVLRVQARLWNSTFIEEFPAVSALEIMVRAKITVNSSIKHLLLRDSDAQVAVMVYPEPVVAEDRTQSQDGPIWSMVTLVKETFVSMINKMAVP